MPEPIKDVKPASSTGDVKVESSPTDDLAKTKADNERLKGALSSLQGERDEIKSRLEKLEEIEVRYGELTARQEVERKRLERGQDTIEGQIEAWRKNLLQKNPDAENWFTDIELKLTKATKTASDLATSQASIERAGELLEEFSEELSETEEYKGMTEEKLLKLLRPFMGQFDTKSPYLKTKKAFKAWKADTAYRKEQTDAKKKEAEKSLSSENGGRSPRESTAQEIFDKKEMSTNDKVLLREKLGINHRPR